VHRCINEHTKCNSTISSDPWYPSRLLRLDQHPEGTTLCVRLVETKEAEISGPYLSLSHRWGTADFIKLLSDNLASMKIDVPFSTLSPTFQDAVWIALEFDCHYLWVDSLCIIQDSDEDWLKESSSMQDVYRHAKFTISAANPWALESGLFSRRYTDQVSSLCHEIRFDADSPKTTKSLVFHDGIWTRLVASAPINRRGWIFQERYLSKRVLHFSSIQLAWECETLEACEMLPFSVDDALQSQWSSTAPKRTWRPTRRQLKNYFRDKKVPPWLDAWITIIEDYSRRTFSEPSDKLIALSGVATDFFEKTGDTYLAGLWKNRFIAHMAWYSMFPSLSSRPIQYRAPSWSWAAIEGRVY
ncbi:HET-domain-containing protein, partial [Byssothecium circinans]